MSQQQPQRKPQTTDPITYGDVFPVSGEIADKPVAPKDASLMQSAENKLPGQTQKGGAASAMQAAAMRNERSGLVGHTDLTVAVAEEGVTVAESDLPGRRVITESVTGQVVGQYYQPRPLSTASPAALASTTIGGSAITIGQALEATALTAGDMPVDQSDAAAIQAAEVSVTGSTVITALQPKAADINVLEIECTTMKLPADKADDWTQKGVVGAELRNNPRMTTHLQLLLLLLDSTKTATSTYNEEAWWSSLCVYM